MEDIYSNVISLTKYMRTVAYDYGQVQEDCDVIPFGGSIKESIGPFPEFILKGHFCNRSLQGFCSPCFYSRLPVHQICEEKFNFGYERQVEYILQNFEKMVISNQIGQVAYNFETNKKVYGMVCTPTGSYFDSYEYPSNIRKRNLRRIIDTADRYNCEIALHIETHVEDVINYFHNPDMEEIELLHHLHTRILLGFESVNNVSRNGIYGKGLSLNNFETAISILKTNNFPVGAFVFAGLFALTDEETIKDTLDTLYYLKDMDVSPVLMFANTQEYTIPDVLLSIGKFKLLDTRTVYIIIKNMIRIFGCDMKKDIDPWFIADPKGGPPDPNFHIFNASTNTSCSKCADEIYNAIEKLRITKDIESFLMIEQTIDMCDCKAQYYDLIKIQAENLRKNNLRDRIIYSIQCAKNEFPYYVLKKNPWVVKAELLCYGLNVSEEQKELLKTMNPFIYEKGFINAIHILYKNTLINVCVADSFCEKSPYSVKKINNSWYLLKNEVVLDELIFLEFPEWVFNRCEGVMVGKIIRPHSDKCISLWPSLDCNYVKKKKGCRFCSLTSMDEDEMIKLQPKFVARLVKVAIDYNPSYEINLSGGTCNSPEYAIDYLLEICNEIIEVCGSVSISVECTPPNSITYLKKLKESGVTAIIMNLEIYDEGLREKICPGKGTISNQSFFSALKEAVDIFGVGNVSSVLIIGIQPKQDIITACEQLTDIGVIPTLIPFKPLDNTSMEYMKVTDSKEYIEISKDVANRMARKKLYISKNSGCTACGACSLESNLMEVYR